MKKYLLIPILAAIIAIPAMAWMRPWPPHQDPPGGWTVPRNIPKQLEKSDLG